ncbi:MAG TPA: ABC transporter permease [Novosphingobium capsulatum]|nr:ABC transporter permease [Novosphingobium aromaticivorans]HIQ17445.1 ABC transporter permease [Novosphingobium capsulatum]
MMILRFLARRLALGLAVLWAAATLTFAMMNLTGGDTAVAILGGPDAMPTAEALAKVRAEYGLDQPLWRQYGDWLWRLVHGDLGQSYRLRIPVSTAIAEQIWPTVKLALLAGSLGVALAIAVALATANRKARWIAATASVVELVLISMPSFVLGIAFLLVFAFYWPVFPVADAPGLAGLALPVITLALPIAATLSQILRAELELVLEQPFILTARARGLSDAGVRLGHALRHTLSQLLTLSGLVFAALLGGAAVTESLFSRPGIGRLLIDATTATDVPVVVGVTIVTALAYVLSSLVVDLASALVDLRTASA